MRRAVFFARILFLPFFLSLAAPAFCDDESKEYSADEFPQPLKDLRRFEIVTLGALPFVTLDTTLVWSGVRWAQNDFSSAYTPNPFASSSEGGFSQDEQFGILFTSIGICVGIGLTDYIIQLIRRNSRKKAAERELAEKNISVTPLEITPDASLPPPEDEVVTLPEER